MTPDIDPTLGNARASLEALLGARPEEIVEGTLDDLARRLSDVVLAIGALRQIEDVLAEALGARMETDEVSITGVGRLARRVRFSSTWIDDSAKDRMYEDSIRAIIAKVAVDPASGEIHGPLAQVVRETWRLVTDAFSLGADPKVPFRKTLGLQPDEYRSKRSTGYTVAIKEETV